jgi:thiamine pyrophosphokinase
LQHTDLQKGGFLQRVSNSCKTEEAVAKLQAHPVLPGAIARTLLWEEALLGIAFTGGGGPSAELVRRLFAAGAAADSLVAAADSGLQAAEAAGLRPDWIVGDMDSLDDLRRLDRYPPERVLRYPAEKDFTDTELAVMLLWENGCDDIWLLGGGGGRIDHLFGIRSLFERERCPSRWITAAEDIYCIAAGGRLPAELALSLRPGSVVSVLPLAEGGRAVSRGLKWPLDGIVWDRGFFGVSNTAPDGEFSITAEQGRFMVIVPSLSHIDNESVQ